MKTAIPGIQVGILGGGQLARMLALKAHQLGLHPLILCAAADEPAARVAPHVIGDVHDRTTVENFLKRVDVATFESEFLNANLLAHAGDAAGTRILPAPDLMGRLQDRLTQKQLLLDHRLPTLPFLEVANLDQALHALGQNPAGVVLKQRRFGYDGYGTFIFRSATEIKKQFALWGAKAPALIAEPLCRFERELAISVVRSRSGKIAVFPLVESKQVESRCFWVKGPVRHRDSAKLITQLKGFVRAIDYVGIIAFEIFATRRQELLINEIAPRVHNSAHYSLDALSLDQFTAHWLAILDLELPTIDLHGPGFAMVNLLGKSTDQPKLRPANGTVLHWYGKAVNRPGRKMGHLNAVGKSADLALRRALSAERKLSL